MRRLTSWSVTSLLLLGTVNFASGQAPADALSKLPATTNSVAIVKVQDLMKTPLGTKEEWAKKHQTQFLAGSVHVPPTVDYLIRGFEFHPEDTRVTKSFGIAGWKKPVVMTKIAEHEKSRIEMVAGHAVLLTDRNSYFAQLGPDMVGAVSPAYRQDLARWLRGVDAGAGAGLSPYLKEVVGEAKDAQILLALDFQDLVDPKSWRDRLKSSPAVLGKPSAVKLMTQLADGLRGVSLNLTVTEKITAKVNLDFNTTVSQTALPLLKPVLIDLLGEAGASLDELENGEATANGKSATITFDLSDAGLRRIMSMILMPTVSDSAAETAAATGDANATPADATKAHAVASRNYYNAINQIFDDLEKSVKKGGNYNRTASWHDNFAKKIDQLSIKNVDRELVTYGAGVASHLRALAVSLRGVPLTVNKLQRSITYNLQYQPAGYRPVNDSIWSSVTYYPEYANIDSNQSEIRGKQAEAIEAGAQQREEIWQIMAADRQQIRQKMQDKFGQDFGA